MSRPQSRRGAALDAEVWLYPGEQRLVFPERRAAVDDAPVRDPAIDILPEFFVELRLVSEFPEDGHIRLDAAHHPRPGRFGNTLRQCVGAKPVAPLFEAEWGGCEGGERVGEYGAGAQAG